MPAPFPGMNPFVESADIWPAFHHEMAAVLYEDLTAKLPSHYSMRLGERFYRLEPTPSATAAAVEHEEQYIEIYDQKGGSLVTLVDLISPLNKMTESGRQAYLHTRQQASGLKANVVEIDLVLQGQPTLDYSREGLPDWDYCVTVNRATRFDRYEIYPACLGKQLPRFRLPVAALEREIIVELQNVFEVAFDQGGFAGRIVYARGLGASVKDASRQRLQELLERAGLLARTSFTHEQIALAAYYAWLEEGCAQGRADEHWRLAMERLNRSGST